MDSSLDSDFLKKNDEQKRKFLEAAETLDAIRTNKIDAFVITTDKGEQVFTLQGSESIYKAILNEINVAALTFTEDGTILYSNKLFNEMIKSDEDRSYKGTPIYKFVSPISASRIESLIYDKIEKIASQLEMIDLKGNLISVNAILKTIRPSGVQPVTLMMISPIDSDVSQSEKLSEDMMNLTSEAVVMCDKEGKILRYNRSAILLSEESFVNKHFDDVFSLSNKEFSNISYLQLLNRKSTNNEFVFSRKDGRTYFLNISIDPLIDKTNNVHGYIFSLSDITKHILAEETAISSLKEKTVLLKEIHHRIKNNLQIIMSIISLQSNHIKDQEAQKSYLELIGRIRSISLLHEQLYQTETLSDVRVDQYIKELITHLKNGYNLNDNRILFEYEIDPISIEHAKMINIGLIITELLTNSIKYAFDSQTGIIKVTLKKSGEKTLLMIQDNGKGISNLFDINESNTLGMQLINALTLQLNGEIKILNKFGTEVRIIF